MLEHVKFYTDFAIKHESAIWAQQQSKQYIDLLLTKLNAYEQLACVRSVENAFKQANIEIPIDIKTQNEGKLSNYYKRFMERHNNLTIEEIRVCIDQIKIKLFQA
jgi:hypothetical protein